MFTRSQPPYLVKASPEMIEESASAKAKAIERAIKSLIVGTTVGAGLAVLANLSRKTPEIGFGSAQTQLPYPQKPVNKEENEERKGLFADSEKRGFIERLSKFLADKLVPYDETSSPIVKTLRGDFRQDPNSIPWAIPAATLAAIGGLLAGKTFVDDAAKKIRDARLDQELNRARHEYEAALLANFDPNRIREIPYGKQASSTSDPLGECFVNVKKAFNSFNLGDAAGYGLGAYLTLAALLAGLASYGVTSYMKRTSDAETAKKIVRKRRIAKSQAEPTALYVTPDLKPYESSFE